MPRYFFHVRDGETVIPDDRGVDLPNLDDALEQCRRVVREVLNETENRDKLTADRQFEIVDELGRLVLTIPFSAVALI
jgi:hypothetical protein